ncbi:uncharacterized protein J3R85_016786 [Psidium guajava]|nr:uncharacterized protein J3R85_016786 [Psidium guajava]
MVITNEGRMAKSNENPFQQLFWCSLAHRFKPLSPLLHVAFLPMFGLKVACFGCFLLGYGDY